MRSLWKGAIRFGLIHIPVCLYSASRIRENSKERRYAIEERYIEERDFLEHKKGIARPS